jgi:hypothetical protein
MSLVEERHERIPVQRGDFAPGKIGQIDFELILSGAGCETPTGEEHERCGKPSIKVLDFDILSSTEQAPVCSSECEVISRAIITKDLALVGKVTLIGINGFGRH